MAVVAFAFMSSIPLVTFAASQHQHASFGMPSSLDEKTKAKANDILTLLKKDLIELGVKFSNTEKPKLDEATKVKVQEIKERIKDGSITKEEAHKQFQELGLSCTMDTRKDIFKGLDAAKKAQAEALINKAKADLKELGIEFHFYMLNQFPK